MKLYQYGMGKKPYGYGNQPEQGLYAVLPPLNSPFSKYYDIIVYDRQLTEDECERYKLKDLGEVL